VGEVADPRTDALDTPPAKFAEVIDELGAASGHGFGETELALRLGGQRLAISAGRH
jgi:hypothetical protein